ncbi:N5-carboxyaminoimidazole ribonucleotide mutase [bioreactor metagenome]|uniref:N5-carboxyaminoimidazole ribonucleotide mutase n=1 Tax=bioreactor metagenome TaxID=1076179 RepID=A0A645GTU8_9ZZZZ|nr:5-(carboxyamino)imidazole ribonucleotide mutase [Oscillospiraceae bacterium]
MKKAVIVMGSDSDLGIMKGCIDTLTEFSIPFEVRIISAHRTPRAAEEFASNARKNGVGVIIAAAGKAAHLAGVLAAYTTLPVIAVPIKGSALDGMDALLSMVQMPSGVPVATVAIDGAANAAILAAQILSLSDEALEAKLTDHKKKMELGVEEKDRKIREQFGI